MTLEVVQVDSFTERPFAGNPAAVCVLPEARSERWMQQFAREMNLPETAFVRPAAGGFELRWFTPQVEVDLCGHATLAAAHVLWEDGGLAPSEAAVFQTRSGKLTACRDGPWIELDFPATPAAPAQAPDHLLDALGCEASYVGRSRFDFLVETPSEEVLRGLKPDLRRLAAVDARGVIVTSRGSGSYDFVSRFFAPASGIDEDPVTGSAHCCLGPYWSEKLGKLDLLAFQASPRGGEVRVRAAGERVLLSGKAVTVFRATLEEAAARDVAPPRTQPAGPRAGG